MSAASADLHVSGAPSAPGAPRLPSGWISLLLWIVIACLSSFLAGTRPVDPDCGGQVVSGSQPVPCVAEAPASAPGATREIR